ncbi:MAG TPA: addiction module protein [Blastocatellia bacterium]|jgi:putative addiction module component (TIGR02574 family)
MTEHAERVKEEVLQLPESDRADLARLLIESLDETEDADAETAWDVELGRRLKRIEEGKASLRPAHQVLAEIKDKHR